jgi:hypothetical protein
VNGAGAALVRRSRVCGGGPAWYGPSGRDGPYQRRAGYAVTACLWSLLVTWMLRGLAASRTGMVRVSTPAA